MIWCDMGYVGILDMCTYEDGELGDMGVMLDVVNYDRTLLVMWMCLLWYVGMCCVMS